MSQLDNHADLPLSTALPTPPSGASGATGAAVTQAFRKQADAAQWLRMQGYKVSLSTFNNHFKSGLIPKDSDGTFTAAALLGYAHAKLTPTVRIEDSESRRAMLDKTASDADLKSVRAARERLRLQKEQGHLMPVAQHEDELAARALFFKSELESYIYRAGPQIIESCGGDHTLLPRLIRFWEESTADWMDAWSQERAFATEQEEEKP